MRTKNSNSKKLVALLLPFLALTTRTGSSGPSAAIVVRATAEAFQGSVFGSRRGGRHCGCNGSSPLRRRCRRRRSFSSFSCAPPPPPSSSASRPVALSAARRGSSERGDDCPNVDAVAETTMVDGGPPSSSAEEPSSAANAIAAGGGGSSPKKGIDALSERQKGLLVLLTVPFAWGSFEPATRYLYAIDPPVPALVFSLSYYLVAATALLSAAAIGSAASSPSRGGGGEGKGDSEPWPVAGGLELGAYLFVGNALQVFGLKTVESDKAAFLLQLTTIFVPLAEAALVSFSPSSSRQKGRGNNSNAFLQAVSLRKWVACLIALAGVAAMSLEGAGGGGLQGLGGGGGGGGNGVGFLAGLPSVLSESLAQWSTGDTYIVAAAVAYTFHCIRLEKYAKSTSAVKLAASKASTETALSLLSVIGVVLYYYSSHSAPSGGDQEAAGTNFALDMGREIVSYGESLSRGLSSGSIRASVLAPALASVLWTGLVTCAYTIYAQSYGQGRVRPVTANLIYTVQPICTAILAWLVLGESLGPAGYVGGALIGSAVLLVIGESPSAAEDASTEQTVV